MTFILCAQEFLLSYLPNMYTPAVETLVCLIQLMQDPNELYVTNKQTKIRQWDANKQNNLLASLKDSLLEHLELSPNLHVLYALMRPYKELPSFLISCGRVRSELFDSKNQFSESLFLGLAGSILTD